MATVPYAYACDAQTGFMPDPNQTKRVGYLTALKGFSPNLTSMLVNIPPIHEPIGYNGVAVTQAPAKAGQINAIAVLEKFQWDGGPGHPLTFEAYVSQESGEQIRAAQQTGLETTKIDAIGWWIIDFDQETKMWYEVCYPLGPVSGTIAGPKDNPELTVDPTPVPVAGIDLTVYKIDLAVTPAVNTQFTFHFATSPATRMVASWGLPTNPEFAAPPS